MNILICPVCKTHLNEEPSHYHCQQNHAFDKARSGYVNLLLSNMKHSKEPGDNKEMVQCRSSFLKQGYYAPISDTLNQHVEERISSSPSLIRHLADIGCGNGYYLHQLKNYLDNTHQDKFQYWGIDISKEAINFAAKESKHIKWVVSNISELPFQANSLDGIISVFSPCNFTEFNRLLNKDGYLFVIYPASHHLYELRKILFSDIKNIEPDRILKQSNNQFDVIEQIPIKHSIHLTTNDDIANLFGMTPYYWRCTAEKKQKILSLPNLELTLDVMLWVFKKKLD